MPGASYTTMAWVYLSVDRNALSTVWTFDAGGTNGHQVQAGSDGTTLQINSAAGTFVGGSLTVGSWTKVAMVINGTTGTLYTGSAGASPSMSSVSGTVSGSLTFTAFRVGAFTNATSGSWLNGQVANFKHYSALLTAAEIDAELGTWQVVRTANLVRHHRFRMAETADYSGNGNTLTSASGPVTASDPHTIVLGRPSNVTRGVSRRVFR